MNVHRERLPGAPAPMQYWDGADGRYDRDAMVGDLLAVLAQIDRGPRPPLARPWGA